jgi:hypothetical protein
MHSLLSLLCLALVVSATAVEDKDEWEHQVSRSEYAATAPVRLQELKDFVRETEKLDEQMSSWLDLYTSNGGGALGRREVPHMGWLLAGQHLSAFEEFLKSIRGSLQVAHSQLEHWEGIKNLSKKEMVDYYLEDLIATIRGAGAEEEEEETKEE